MALNTITPIKRSEEYLQRIADAIEGSGGSDLPAVTSADNDDVLTVVNGAWDKAAPASQLPAVTSSDNGDVLTVVSGEWTKAAPSGGALIVKATGECTYVDGGLSDPSTWTVGVDKTAAEIAAAFDPDTVKPVYVLIPYFTTGSPYYTYEQDIPDGIDNRLVLLNSSSYTTYFSDEATHMSFEIGLNRSGDFEIYAESLGEA